MSDYAYVGGLTIGEVVPIALTAQGAIDASVGLALPELQAKLSGLLAIQANVSLQLPTIAGSISALLSLAAALQAALSVGAPSVAIDVSGIAKIAAQIAVDIGSLQAQLDIAVDLGLKLGGGSVHAYHATGQAIDIIPVGIPGVGDTTEVNALILVAATSADWAAVQAVFKTEA